MEHALIYTLISSIVVAFFFGMLARKFNLPTIFGYLIAGIAIGPHTPGFEADVELARQLAEIGIILLMFGVGLHFSFRDLLQVKNIALPGAVAQMLCAIVVGTGIGCFMGYGVAESMVFGLSLSVASTIVLIRSLEQRDMLSSPGGKLAIGWLVVEDIVMVLALVMLPLAATSLNSSEPVNLPHIMGAMVLVIVKIALFFVFNFIVGRRFLPPLLMAIARMRSSELSTLGTLAIALGFASIAHLLFDASLALGAFLGGMVLGESEVGRKSAKNSLPMRDAFSVLFFVSVGMLFEPMTLINHPFAVLMTLAVIVVAKGLAALAITSLFKQPHEVGYAVAIGLAQIGEFSFILGGMAMANQLLTQELYNLILAGAMLSIVLNPFLFRLYDRFYQPAAA